MKPTFTTREAIVKYCLTYPEVYEDYPFDDNWCMIRHNSKWRQGFIFIYERQGVLYANVKSDPGWSDVWRKCVKGVTPAYHMDKKHWNTIILDGTVPDDTVRDIIGMSFELTR